MVRASVTTEVHEHTAARLECVCSTLRIALITSMGLGAVQAQKAAGVDAVIMDDVGRLAKATGKASSAFNRPLRSPSSFQARTAWHWAKLKQRQVHYKLS